MYIFMISFFLYLLQVLKFNYSTIYILYNVILLQEQHVSFNLNSIFNRLKLRYTISVYNHGDYYQQKITCIIIVLIVHIKIIVNNAHAN